MYKSLFARRAAVAALAIFLAFAVSPRVSLAQDDTLDPERTEAERLFSQGKLLAALPILERIILTYPNDAELWAKFGMAIISNSASLNDPDGRKEEQERGVKALKRAKQLGTENVRALDMLDQFEKASGFDNFVSDNPEVEKALREGEAFFGRGEYDEAFKAYERAYTLDPKNYQAVLYMGDCYYARKMYAEAEPWFAKAVEIDPNRETAQRYWGDALLNQRRLPEARDRFIEAIIASPWERLSWSSLDRWADAAKKDLYFIQVAPPGAEIGGPIEIKDRLLREDDGTINWREYTRTRSRLDPLGGSSPKLEDDVAAYRSVADAFRKELKAGKIRYPDPGLVNLLRLVDDGFLEAYVFIVRPYDHYKASYASYREKNRKVLRDFILRYVVEWYD